MDVGNKKRKHEKQPTSPPNKKLSNEILSDVVTLTVENQKQSKDLGFIVDIYLFNTIFYFYYRYCW